MDFTKLISRRHQGVNLALLDQSLVSGANFLASILIAKWLGLAEFGVFSVGWLAVLFINSIHAPMIIFPLMTIGPKQPKADLPGYHGAVLVHELIFSTCAATLVFILVEAVALVRPDWHVTGMSTALALATAGYHLQDYVRRRFFVVGRPGAALANDIVTHGSRLVLFAMVLPGPSADAITTLYLITLTSTIGFIAGLVLFTPCRFERPIILAVARRHWLSAKWLTTSGLMQWASVNVYLVVAGALLGSATVGAVKAAQNILGLAQILFQGLENIVPSTASRHYLAGGNAALRGYLIKVAILGGIGTAMIGATAAIPAAFWLQLFYGEEFVAYTNTVYWYTAIYIAMFMILPIRAGFRTIERTASWSRAYLITSAFSLVAVYPLARGYGLEGIMFGMLASLIVLISLGTYYLWAAIRDTEVHSNTVETHPKGEA